MSIIKPNRMAGTSTMCKVGGCHTEVPLGNMACDYHWRFLSKETQKEVTEAYRLLNRVSSTANINRVRDVVRKAVEEIHDAMRRHFRERNSD